MPVFTGSLSIYDAGDTVNLLFGIIHFTTTGYRLNLTVTYPTEYFSLDTNDTESVRLYINGVLQENSSTVNPENGTILCSTNMLDPQVWLIAAITLTALNTVENANSYVVPHTLDWHNLPYGLEGGRYYNTSGDHSIPIKTSQLSVDFITSDGNTPGNIVQLQEQISVNVTVTLPEVSSI